MVINTYVSRLISKANKHIIIHPVHLPLTLLHEDKRSRDFTHSPGNFHLMRHTWVISPSTDGVLAERLLQTFRKRSGSLGGGPDWMKLCVFKAVIVCFPPLSVLGCRSPEKRSVPLDQKVLQWKEWHHLSCSSFEVKNRGSVTQGGPSETQTHHCYLKPRRGEEDFLFRETLKTHSTKEERERKLPDSASLHKSSVSGFLCRSKSQRRAVTQHSQSWIIRWSKWEAPLNAGEEWRLMNTAGINSH